MPAADRARKREEAIREAEMDRVAAAGMEEEIDRLALEMMTGCVRTPKSRDVSCSLRLFWLRV